MSQDRLPREGESEAQSILLACRGEWFKKLVPHLGRDSGTGVSDADHGAAIVLSGRDVDASPLAEGLERVCKQVEKDPFHARPLDGRFQRFWYIEADLHMLRFRHWEKRLAGSGDEIA
jgi:hypothetical protein